MSININFQLAESLRFMGKRLQKIPRKKFIIFGISLMIASGVCCESLKVVNMFSACFCFGGALVVYNTFMIIIKKITSLFRK